MQLTYHSTQTVLPAQITNDRRLHYYDKGEEIPLNHEGLWQVYRGFVQLSHLLENGEEVLLGWTPPSAFFGLWLTHLDSYQAKALSDLYLRWYPLPEIQNSPQLSQLALSQVARRLRQTEALLSMSGFRRVDEKLQYLLSLLKEELGQPTAEGTRLSVRLTHQHLANAIGTTRVTITRLMGDFQRQGLISIDSDRHIIIHTVSRQSQGIGQKEEGRKNLV